jgi:HAMP domain-containing protein
MDLRCRNTDTEGMSDVPPKQGTTDEPGPGSEANDLQPWQRVACLVLGVASGVSGGVATFVSKNQAGSVALLLIGAIFTLVALVDIVPIRFKASNIEVELQRLRRITTELAAAVQEARLPVPQPAMEEDALADKVRRVLDELGAESEDRTAAVVKGEPGLDFDLLVTMHGQQLAVLVLSPVAATREVVKAEIDRARGLSGLLLVFREQAPVSVERLVVEWSTRHVQGPEPRPRARLVIDTSWPEFKSEFAKGMDEILSTDG